MIEELKAFMDRVGSRGIRYLKENQTLYNWVIEQTPQLAEDVKLTERVFVILNGDIGICKRGNRRPFKTYEEGYYKSGCFNQCPCRRELQSKAIKSLPPRPKKEYVPHPLTPEQHKAIMAHAREAYRKQTGLENPFQSEEVKEKSRNTMLEKYGVEHPTHMDNHLDKIRSTHREKTGFDYWTHDPEKLSSLNMSIEEVANHFDIGYSTVQRKFKKYGFSIPSRSSGEIAVETFIQSLGVKTVNSQRILPIGPRKQEIDIFIPELNIGVEYCGLYTHSENSTGKQRDYHQRKYEVAKDMGIRLITIFEDEWLKKRSICESRLKHILGKSERGPSARQCSIDEVSWKDASGFLDLHHIQGAGAPTKENFGLYHLGELIALMTFGNPRKIMGRRDGFPELMRFTTDGRNIPGAASRLFKAYQREHKPDGLISYCDLRWGNGDLYRNLGFDLIGFTKPGFWFIDKTYTQRIHRSRLQKHMFLKEWNRPDLTGWELAQEFGYDRMWDCGSLKFQKIFNEL